MDVSPFFMTQPNSTHHSVNPTKPTHSHSNNRDPTQLNPTIYELKCGPMPNLMVALPNTGGALCSTPQSLADAHY